MLTRLAVENYALIDSLEIEFDAHLNIITGETGAGKSILMGALSLLLGAKNDGGAIKESSRSCIIEAEFDIEGLSLEEFFEEHDLDYDNHTIIRRTISPSGKSRAFINDQPVQLTELKEVGAYLLVDMAHIAGLVAAGKHPSPIPYADVTTTTTHKTLRGPRGGLILTNDEDIAKAINKAIFPGTQGGPLMHTIAAKAVCFGEALKPSFTEYAQRVIDNTAALAEGLIEEGFRLVSGGTDNHLMLVDLSGMKVDTGKEAEHLLDEIGITCNKNSIPNDKQKPTVTSGLRFGSAAVTSRGFNTDDMREVAKLISMTLKDFEGNADEVRTRVAALLAKYPLYE